jgi:hypothetical protein
MLLLHQTPQHPALFAGQAELAILIASARSVPSTSIHFPPREHFVKHRPEGEDVRPDVRVLSFELLQDHVLERAEDGSLFRESLLRKTNFGTRSLKDS